MAKASAVLRATVGLFALSGLYGCDAAQTYFDRLYAPDPNPNPTYRIEVSGLNEADFDISMSVKFITANDRCRRTYSWAAGASGPRVTSVALEVQRSGSAYRASGPIDAFKPGYCNWVPFSLNYEIRRGDRRQASPVPPSPVVWFVSNGRSSLTPVKIACVISNYQGRQDYLCNVPIGDHKLTLSSHKLEVNFVEQEWRNKPSARIEDKRAL